jgi:hypothetical protein
MLFRALVLGTLLGTFAAQGADAATAAPRKMYMLLDVGKILVFRDGTLVRTIAGKDTKMRSTFGIAQQILGDLVVSNAGDDGLHGSIVTVPDGNGDVAAKSAIACKGFRPWGIAVDGDSNIWMADYEGKFVRAYRANASGCPTPVANIAGPHTGLTEPLEVAIDRKGRIVVTNYYDGGIEVFAPGSNGDAAPLAQIRGSKAQVSHSEGMALDANNNIYLANYAAHSVTEYAAGANGNVAPVRRIAGPHTLLDAPIGIAVGRRMGNIYVADYGTHAVLVFAADANGDAAPIAKYYVAIPTGVVVHE